MKYTCFLFDADDTLFDFAASERHAFAASLKDFDLPFSDDVYSFYKKVSSGLWEQVEKGQISKDFLRVERFRLLMKEYKFSVSATEISEFYLRALVEKVHLEDHAIEICQSLSAKATIGIITNGIEEVQETRLEKSGLFDYVSFMVVSEKCGFAKPDRRFFEYTMSQISETPREEILVVGDRLETDVKGANLFGLDSCWYNPSRRSKTCEIADPTYEIHDLSELKNFS